MVHDYVENLLLTVLDFQMHGTAVKRAIEYYRQNVSKDIADFAALKSLLAMYPDDKEGNLKIAVYLWNYKHWTRVELLRRLVKFFEAEGITTQEQLNAWASRASFERDFKGKVKGAGLSIFNWLVIRQGRESINPGIWVHRFIEETVGYDVSDAEAVELLKKVAQEIGVKAHELDWRIWEHQRGQPW